MANRDEILRELIVEEIRGLLTNPVLFNSLLRYSSAQAFTNPRDIPDLGEVMYQIGMAGGSTKAVIIKQGSDVDVNGDLDLTGETIPVNATYSVYINGISGLQAISYNEITSLMSGFFVAPADDIKIIFI